MKKKILLFLLSIFIVINLVSCGDTSIEETTSSDTSLETSQNAIYNATDSICETPTRIFYANGSQIFYYNKLDRQSYVFCFDSLCKHNTNDCISKKFFLMGDSQPFRYCEYDNRIYTIRGTKFCSMSFDGSDLQIHYSFSDADEFSDSRYDILSLMYLEVHGHYAYMCASDSETGNWELYRYNIKYGTMKKLTKNSADYDNVQYFTSDGTYIYFWSNQNGSVCLVRSDMNLKNMQVIAKEALGIYHSSIFDGENFYLVNSYEDKTTGKTEIISDKIMAYNVNDRSETVVCYLKHGAWVTLLSATDRYIYYTVYDPTVVGMKKTHVGLMDVVNEYSKIYRYDTTTEETVVVFDDLGYEIDKIYMMQDHVLIDGYTFVSDNEYVKSNGAFMIADIDENGMFVNLRIIEEPR